MASRQVGSPAGAAPQLTISRSAPDRHLEGQRAGVVQPVGAARKAGAALGRAGWRGRAAIGDHEGAAGGEAVEAGLLQEHRRAAARLALRQDDVDHRRRLLARGVEQGEAAIAVAEQPQGQPGPLQRGGELRRRGDAAAVQEVADLDQVLQRQQLDGGLRSTWPPSGWNCAPARRAGTSARAASTPRPRRRRRRR
jgi:hypothetical protein